MNQSLTEIAEQLKDSDKKVQLIYAFNGSGKTRLSREFKELIAPKKNEEETEDNRAKVVYYNAFTEDLFYWDNDLKGDTHRKLKIQPNNYTQWVLQEQGQDQNAIAHFQRYTSDKLTPKFNPEYKTKDEYGKEITVPAFSEVTFSFERGNEESTGDVKISKGEESNFIWSIFYSLLEQIIEVLNVSDAGRSTDIYDKLEYVFIDDPVSSLDENHLIELAVNIASLIKSVPKDSLKFIITTHNPLFYNVLFNALKKGNRCILTHNEDGSFSLETQKTDSPFSYHLHLIEALKSAYKKNELEKYHYNFLRNILEKTSTFLGYDDWSDLLPKTADGTSDLYLKRIVDISSHSKHSGHELSELSQDDKRVLRFLLGATANKKYEFPERYQVELKEGTADD